MAQTRSSALRPERPGQELAGSLAFSVFFDSVRKRQLLAADIWTCLDYLIDDKLRGPKNSKVRDRATEHLWQGFEFYEAARTPRFDTRPLLYYYSFLNVAKAFLLARAVSIPTRAGHGVTDPPTNERKKVRLEGQSIKLEAA